MTTTTDATGWETRAGELTASGRAFIGNESVDARSGATFEKRSPVDGRHLATVAACDAPDVDDAVRAARKAFESGVWAELAPRDRKTILLEYAGRIFNSVELNGSFYRTPTPAARTIGSPPRLTGPPARWPTRRRGRRSRPRAPSAWP